MRNWANEDMGSRVTHACACAWAWAFEHLIVTLYHRCADASQGAVGGSGGTGGLAGGGGGGVHSAGIEMNADPYVARSVSSRTAIFGHSCALTAAQSPLTAVVTPVTVALIDTNSW
eukprot:2218160-Prymnesium_polylepis.1